MNAHEQIHDAVKQVINVMDSLPAISTACVVSGVQRIIGVPKNPVAAMLQRTGLTQIVSVQLRKAYGAKSEAALLEDDDDDSGMEPSKSLLQDRYPVIARQGAGFVWKRIEELNDIEGFAAVARLRKRGRGFMAHADELEAYLKSRELQAA
jgi:hypothetical protein